MLIEVVVPADLWEEDSEAVITTWFVDSGVDVEQGDLLAEIMVEKIQHEISAPGNGVITIHKESDEVVKKGDVIASIA